MDTISGLPAHPLIVHFPIVAIPLAAILVLIYLFKSDWRSMLDYFLIAMGGAIAISVVMASGSGESLQEKVDKSAALSTHTELGDQMQIIGVIFGIALIALGLYHTLAARQIIHLGTETQKRLLIGLMAATVLTGAVAVTWIVRTGHTGAKASWSDTGSGKTEGEGQGDDASVPSLASVSALHGFAFDS